jgi:hypothetical protein
LEDAAEIFDVQVADLIQLDGTALSIIPENDERFVKELDLHKAWGSGAIPSKHPARIGSAKRSLDELILMRLIAITYPEATIKPQAKAGRKQVDLVVQNEGREVAVEFFGPSHFIPQYGRQPGAASERKAVIQDALNCECVIWPYWIQRCELNVRALFEPSVAGLASVWSTKAHFGDFVSEDAAETILDVTQRFNALADDGIGYMYLNSRTPNKPVHPIVKRIAAGRERPERLIPRGNKKPPTFWLPQLAEAD